MSELTFRRHNLSNSQFWVPDSSSSQLSDLLVSPLSSPHSWLLQDLDSRTLALLSGQSHSVFASDYTALYTPMHACRCASSSSCWHPRQRGSALPCSPSLIGLHRHNSERLSPRKIELEFNGKTGQAIVAWHRAQAGESAEKLPVCTQLAAFILFLVRGVVSVLISLKPP